MSFSKQASLLYSPYQHHRRQWQVGMQASRPAGGRHERVRITDGTVCVSGSKQQRSDKRSTTLSSRRTHQLTTSSRRTTVARGWREAITRRARGTTPIYRHANRTPMMMMMVRLDARRRVQLSAPVDQTRAAGRHGRWGDDWTDKDVPDLWKSRPRHRLKSGMSRLSTSNGDVWELPNDFPISVTVVRPSTPVETRRLKLLSIRDARRSAPDGQFHSRPIYVRAEVNEGRRNRL